MHKEPRAVWERYVRSWKVIEPAEKREIFATCLAPNCIYTDPLIEARGWDELTQYMSSFHAQVPGGHFVTQQFFSHGRRSVARWQMVSAEGAPLGEGISYAEYDGQQQLLAVTGFFEPPQSPEQP
jgi:SnoaL-like domain